MPNKILVTYASRLGSTAGVAEAIGKTLAENGAEVEVRRMEDVTDLTPYSAVVAGSAIRGKQWLPEAMQFMQDSSSGVEAETLCRVSGVHDAGDEERREIPPALWPPFSIPCVP